MIVQDDRFDATGSITICAITSDKSEAPLFRIVIQPSDQTRLTTTSRLMVDKITTIPKSKLGSRIGNLDAVDMARVNQAMLIFLGLAGSGGVSMGRSYTTLSDPSGPRATSANGISNNGQIVGDY